MIKKKICMLGAYNVGKTSLVRQFVFSIFEDRYHSTIGVKIDKKEIEIEDQKLQFMLWDVAGEDERFSVPPSYLRGAAGYLLVIDGTRKKTLEQALNLQERAEEAVGNVPFIAVLNKCDLMDEWELDENVMDELSGKNWEVLKTSAKLGTGVEEVFLKLGKMILSQ